MKKKIDLNNTMDDALTKAVDSMEMQPSDNVWKGIDTGLTRSENVLLRKRILFWKRASLGLSSVVAAAGIFFFYHFNQHDLSNEKRVADMRMNHSESSQVKAETVTGLISQNTGLKQERKVEIPSPEKEIPIAAVQEKAQVSGANISRQVTIAEENPVHHKTNVLGIKQSQPAAVTAGSSDKATNKQNDIVIVTNESQAEKKNTILPETKQNPDETGEVKADSVSAKKDSSILAEVILPLPKTENTVPAVKEDSIAKSIAKNTPPNNKDLLSHIYIEGIFSPDLTTRFIKDNDPYDKCTSDFVKSHEANNFSYSEGIKIGYDLGKWSLQTGCLYTTQTLCIRPMTMYPYLSNGQMQCSLVTSSGTVDIPYAGLQSLGDSMRVKGDSRQTLGFLSIPLQLKYKLGGNNKLSFYVLSGISVNILVKQETNLEIAYDYADDDYRKLTTIKGPKNIYYGYSLGAGASYRLRRWYASIEPSLRGAMSSINDNAPVKTYPYTLGLGVMIGYHF